jgi:hypothetical protein
MQDNLPSAVRNVTGTCTSVNSYVPCEWNLIICSSEVDNIVAFR